MPKLRLHGAAGEVTGSFHLVRFDDQWIALDCGLYQGTRAEAEEKNRAWPVPPQDIAAVVLTHAHADHAARLPRLVRDGFDGPIFTTPATRDLCAITLPDSAHIQEEDVFYVNKKRRKQGLPAIEPLYSYDDVVATVEKFQTISYERLFQVIPGVLATFQDAGHMLGSAGVRLSFAKRAGDTASLFYTGDLGRKNKPILRDPRPIPAVRTILCESTYGGRVTASVADAKEQLLGIVLRTLGRRGKVIIPAFAVGRAQTIVYFLNQAMLAGDMPRVPVYVDSPLAVNATEVFRLHPECFDAEARALHRERGDILGSGCCTFIRDVEESKALHARKEPCIIISSSGMCEAGRIRHHLKNNVHDPKNTLLFPGFQAAHTLGRRLVEGVKKITLFHEEYLVRAEVVQLEGFSGHADQADLLALLKPHAGQTHRIVLVHGEEDQTAALAEKLRTAGFPEVVIGTPGQVVDLA
ncbi:MAG: MBL fold metallo-hydrolase [Phycisphaerales bacterium]|nr:MBL fold metallo-hydrolase [Phycisphaerales bacterium]